LDWMYDSKIIMEEMNYSVQTTYSSNLVPRGMNGAFAILRCF